METIKTMEVGVLVENPKIKVYSFMLPREFRTTRNRIEIKRKILGYDLYKWVVAESPKGEVSEKQTVKHIVDI